jgi:hypothetical protein
VSSGSSRLPTLGLIIGTWQSPHSDFPPICYSSSPSFPSPPAPLADRYKYPECLLQTWLAEPAAIAVYLFRIVALVSSQATATHNLSHGLTHGINMAQDARYFGEAPTRNRSAIRKTELNRNSGVCCHFLKLLPSPILWFDIAFVFRSWRESNRFVNTLNCRISSSRLEGEVLVDSCSSVISCIRLPACQTPSDAEKMRFLACRLTHSGVTHIRKRIAVGLGTRWCGHVD